MATAKPLMYLYNWSLPMAKPLPHHKRFRRQWEMRQMVGGDQQLGVGLLSPGEGKRCAAFPQRHCERQRSNPLRSKRIGGLLR
jgi:hypothetical protein